MGRSCAFSVASAHPTRIFLTKLQLSIFVPTFSSLGMGVPVGRSSVLATTLSLSPAIVFGNGV